MGIKTSTILEAAPAFSGYGNSRSRRLEVIIRTAFVIALLTAGCRSPGDASRSSDLAVSYHNARYNLTLLLPADWRGYSTSIQCVEDQTYLASKDKSITVGYTPMITVRYPGWRVCKPCQDIPIFVFERAQWDSLHHGELWPSILAGGTLEEMWHNEKYVFAISSRTFNEELIGWREAARIVEQNRFANKMTELYPE